MGPEPFPGEGIFCKYPNISKKRKLLGCPWYLVNFMDYFTPLSWFSSPRSVGEINQLTNLRSLPAGVSGCYPLAVWWGVALFCHVFACFESHQRVLFSGRFWIILAIIGELGTMGDEYLYIRGNHFLKESCFVPGMISICPEFFCACFLIPRPGIKPPADNLPTIVFLMLQKNLA